MRLARRGDPVVYVRGESAEPFDRLITFLAGVLVGVTLAALGVGVVLGLPVPS